MAFYEPPGLWVPDHDEVHVSCTFTWDIPEAERLAAEWQFVSKKVKIGGPAFGDQPDEFTPGLYVRQGITFTSRGCPNNCPFCFVPRNEGRLREIAIQQGSIIQDNNFLACSRSHRAKVYEMLKGQGQVNFKGGLEAARLTDWDIEEMRGLHIAELWIACDTREAIPRATRTIMRLRAAGFKQYQIRCYVLIGDDMNENQARLEAVFEAGALPFAQLFQDEDRRKYSKKWEDFARLWSRPALYKTAMKKRGGESG
jgi:hypothetical protein